MASRTNPALMLLALVAEINPNIISMYTIINFDGTIEDEYREHKKLYYVFV